MWCHIIWYQLCTYVLPLPSTPYNLIGIYWCAHVKHDVIADKWLLKQQFSPFIIYKLFFTKGAQCNEKRKGQLNFTPAFNEVAH